LQNTVSLFKDARALAVEEPFTSVKTELKREIKKQQLTECTTSKNKLNDEYKKLNKSPR